MLNASSSLRCESGLMALLTAAPRSEPSCSTIGCIITTGIDRTAALAPFHRSRASTCPSVTCWRFTASARHIGIPAALFQNIPRVL